MLNLSLFFKKTYNIIMIILAWKNIIIKSIIHVSSRLPFQTMVVFLGHLNHYNMKSKIITRFPPPDLIASLSGVATSGGNLRNFRLKKKLLRFRVILLRNLIEISNVNCN